MNTRQLFVLLLSLAMRLPCAAFGSARAEAPQMLPRIGIHDQTAIVKAGRALAVIVYPADDSAYAALAEKVREAIQHKTGVSLPIRGDDHVRSSRFVIDRTHKKKNLILLGNLNTNPALVQLGGLAFVYATREWPGDNGYVLRSMTSPFGTKSNCILLGGSDVAGVSMAVDRLVELVHGVAGEGDLVVPRLCRIVVNGEDLTQSAARPLGERGPFNGTYRVAHVIEHYHRTGSTAQLQVVQKVLREYLDGDDVPAEADYGTESAIRALDLVDTFAFTDEENLKMDRLILDWVLKTLERRPYWNAQGRRWSFGGHQACGAMSFLAAVEYLLKNGHPNKPARRLLETQADMSREFLRYLSTSFKDAQKDVGWETWTPLAVPGRFALIQGDMTYFEHGVIRQVVQRYFYAGRGFGPAAIAAFVFNDGRYKTLAPDGGRVSGWAYVLGGPKWVTPRELEPAEPDFIIGTKVMLASPTDWENAHRNAPRPSSWYTPLEQDKTFHLIGFTGGVGENDTMLVLGGWDSLGHPGEANSIRLFRKGGHHYLFRADGNDNRKPRPGRFYQNSIVVESARYDTAPPCAAELLAHVELAEGGMTASRLGNYQGVDWDRNIFWRRGRYFAVIDVCHIKEDGPVTIVNQWWNQDAPALRGNRWSGQSGGGTFHLVMANPGVVSSRRWMKGGPHQLRQGKHLKARSGDVVTYLNLFFVDGTDAAQHYDIRRLGPSVMIVKGTCRSSTGSQDEIALIGCGENGFAHEPWQIRGNLFFVSSLLVMADAKAQIQIGERNLMPRHDGSLSAEDTERVQRALLDLWERAEHPQMNGETTGVTGEAEPKATIRLSERRKMGIETGFRPIAGVGFEQHEDRSVTWDLGRPQAVTRIEGIRFEGDTAKVRYDTNALSDTSPVVTATKGLEKQWVYYQYGFAASVGISTLGPINQSGRYFRVEVPGGKWSHGRWIHQEWHGQAWNISGHNPELFDRPFWQDVVFRSDSRELDYTRRVVADLDGDGRDELVVATDRNELFVLNADGEVRWKHKFDAPVTNLICEELYGNAFREVLCTTHDTALHIFKYDGKIHTRIDKLKNSGLNSLSLIVEPSGQRGLFVGTYHKLLKLDVHGDVLRSASGSGFYQDTMPSTAWDITGDGVPDLVVRENLWGLVSLIDGQSLKAIASHRTRHAGRGLAIMPWPVPGVSRVNRFVVIAESGLAMLQVMGREGKPQGGDAATVAGGLESIFAIPIASIVGWGVADVNGDGTSEIVVASRYGAIMILDGAGQVLASRVVAPELYDIAVAVAKDGQTTIFAATNLDIRKFDRNLNLVATSPRDSADCRLIQAVVDGDGLKVVCLFADGQSAFVLE